MKETLSPEKVREIFDNLNPTWKDMFTFQFETGCRVSEALTLTWGCVSSDGLIVDIKPHTLPDGTEWRPKRPASIRQIELPHRLVPENTLWSPNSSVFFSWVRPGHYTKLPTYWGALSALRTAARKAGVEKIGTHDLRRARITQALAAGGDPNMVRAAVGHGSLKTTIGYVCHVPLRSSLPSSGAEPMVNPPVAAWAAAVNSNKWDKK